MTLQFYFSRRFIAAFLGVFGIFAGLIWLVDMLEYLRRFSGSDFTLSDAGRLATLNLPDLIYGIVPLILLFATIAMFLRMARTSELIVTRAAGRSAIRSLLAPVVVATMLGVLGITAFNPIVAGTSKMFEEAYAGFKGDVTNVLSISSEGLWLRQTDGDGKMVIRAEGAGLGGTVLENVTFLGFNANERASYRVEASRAQLTPGAWVLENAKRWDLTDTSNPEANAVVSKNMQLESDLTVEQIRDSFANPSSIPFWELPTFIRQMEEVGFAARKHRVWFQMELASPAFLISMVLIGASFTMRHTRFGHTGLMVLFAVLLGFSMFFLRNFAQVLGESGNIPPLAAAWAPPLAAISLSLALLLHQEDG